MKLSERCRREALRDPQGCRTTATQKAKADCKQYEGQGLSYGGCMNARFEYHLATECLPHTCPGDPFALEVEELNLSTPDMSQAGKGGGFSTAEQELIARQAAQQGGGERGGVALSDMQKYLLVGLGVVAVLAVAVKKR